MQNSSANLDERNSLLEEYISNVGQRISNDLREKDYNFPNKWIVDFLIDTSAESIQAAYKLMRYVPKHGNLNQMTEVSEYYDDWHDNYRSLQRLGSTLVVISKSKSQLKLFGNHVYTKIYFSNRRINDPPVTAGVGTKDYIEYVTDEDNYYFDMGVSTNSTYISKYDESQKKRYINLQSRLHFDEDTDVKKAIKKSMDRFEQ
jgi:hypothetical protein